MQKPGWGEYYTRKESGKKKEQMLAGKKGRKRGHGKGKKGIQQQNRGKKNEESKDSSGSNPFIGKVESHGSENRWR